MSNKVAVVTGASQGIGRATAIRLAKDFSCVVLVARSEDKLNETAGQVAALGARPLVIAVDRSTDVSTSEFLPFVVATS